jgi:hypothetical protein
MKIHLNGRSQLWKSHMTQCSCVVRTSWSCRTSLSDFYGGLACGSTRSSRFCPDKQQKSLSASLLVSIATRIYLVQLIVPSPVDISTNSNTHPPSCSGQYFSSRRGASPSAPRNRSCDLPLFAAPSSHPKSPRLRHLSRPCDATLPDLHLARRRSRGALLIF